MNIIIIIIIAILIVYYIHSEYNTVRFVLCDEEGCAKYNVHDTFYDKREAAIIMAEIIKRVEKLRDFMDEKYDISITCENCTEGEMSIYVKNFKKKYNPSAMHEISPYNGRGLTSFTEGKGEKLVICLRDKSGKFHSINTLMFVVLHEITHIMNYAWGHTNNFWRLFATVLKDSVEIGIYTPVDYSKYPIEYCKYITIDSSPLY